MEHSSQGQKNDKGIQLQASEWPFWKKKTVHRHGIVLFFFILQNCVIEQKNCVLFLHSLNLYSWISVGTNTASALS